MTIQEAVAMADELKPNAFSTATKIAWLNALEGRIALCVFLMSEADAEQLHYTADDLTRTLLVKPPYDDIYELWLEAKIDYANGEYDKYQNTMAEYNAHYGEFVRYFAERYAPAQRPYGCPLTPEYYISAYALAVKAGYEGTLEDWLESLHGAPGAPGADGSDGVSPTIRVSDVAGGHRITITDATHGASNPLTFDVFDGQDGTNGRDGEDGQDGADGAPGADGVSPSVSVEDIPRGHRITITDATHPASNPLSFDVLNGTDGQGAGDMTKQIYDPTGKEQDVFAYVDAAVAGKGTYSKPSGGIPKSDLADGVQGSLDAADSAYQKPSTGIPKTDLASAVQTSLGKADTAYQKPSTGIPKSALASAVQTSLGKADTALQTAPVSSVDGKTGAVSTHAETTVSLTAAGWTGSSAPYSQQVSVTGVASGKIVILDLNLTAGQTDAATLEAWNNICKYGQALGSGTITFYTDTKPSAAVSVRVGVIG